jgi:hypothetical protein
LAGFAAQNRQTMDISLSISRFLLRKNRERMKTVLFAIFCLKNAVA